MSPAQLLQGIPSSSSNYPGRALSEVHIDTRPNLEELEEEDFLVDGGVVAFTEQRQEAGDELESEETFHQHIDEDLQGRPGSSSRSSQALYEDSRSLQRKIIEFASETLASPEEMASTHNDFADGPARFSRLDLDEEHPVQAPRDRGLNRIMPYRSLRSATPTTGLNLIELRTNNQVLVEDTLGNIHYVSLSVDASWQGLKTFIYDCYTYHFIYATAKTPARNPVGGIRSSEPYAIKGHLGVDAENLLIWKLLPSDSFPTEHGVTIKGDQKLYLKHAFQRAIERDQYRLEDHSGNGAHVQYRMYSEKKTGASEPG
ncbi:hypothetical protein BKA61DRAFT_569811 [Leptodontidium sp. MPI-SDFR-AT-0119]|nr:hypothetical protein BKA61DRAFT_569811 [Leptodontidium sp. MPI-SDFR-AT-0119]